MNFSEFEFAHPEWLWLFLIPIIVGLLAWSIKYRLSYFLRVRDFADAHLLPHLLMTGENNSVGAKKKSGLKWISWTMLWLFGVLALAGPRWNYEEQEVWKKNANLMILLDLSESMRVEDLPHSRLEQALQDIEELLDNGKNTYIGLMVFAGIPHLVAPLTDDYQTLRHLLYELKVDLLPIQGSRLAPALDSAAHWLKGQATTSIPHLLLISDGEFAADDLQESLALVQKGHFYLHTLGVGTSQGNFIPVKDGAWQRDENGEVVISRLEEKSLQQLAITGSGIYRKADFRSEDTQAILGEIKRSINEATQDKTLQKLWHERFYLLVGLMMILILPWFRRQRTVNF
ncbi:VWA domain-containing protein [Candidatus Parabeggiatoa sp. HSG14]|uniref:vWA domain-containing protein n=1 Tax=Candidatus Parabeggiatoa sp. HSG14 TaxID=3055593 RepID=UPI0025A88EAC|nr:VWA domain-containing protein [Thiotrichales bacterium HSG14]